MNQAATPIQELAALEEQSILQIREIFKSIREVGEHLVALKAENERHTKVGVTAVIRNGNGDVLLGKKARSFDPALVGKWVTPGGRVGFGEHLTHAIHREVMEETGLTIDITGSLSPRELLHPEGHFVFIVYEAKATSATTTAGDDISELRWCDETALVDLAPEMTPLTFSVLTRT